MSGRVSTDDLANAELAVRHEADTYLDGDQARAALLRVADWLHAEQQRRYRRMSDRTIGWCRPGQPEPDRGETK